MSSALMIENTELKKKVALLEEKNMQFQHMIKESINDKFIVFINCFKHVEDLMQVQSTISMKLCL